MANKKLLEQGATVNKDFLLDYEEKQQDYKPVFDVMSGVFSEVKQRSEKRIAMMVSVYGGKSRKTRTKSLTKGRKRPRQLSAIDKAGISCLSSLSLISLNENISAPGNIRENEKINVWLLHDNLPILSLQKDMQMRDAEDMVLDKLGEMSSTLTFYEGLKELDMEKPFCEQLSYFPADLYAVTSPKIRKPASVYLSEGKDGFKIGDKEDPHVLMPCGHVVCPESLVMHCKYEIKKGKSQIKCPFKHDVPEYWTLEEIQPRACLSPSECRLFEILLSKNWIKNSTTVFTCPNCEDIIDDEGSRLRSYFTCRKCKNTKFCRRCFRRVNLKTGRCSSCDASQETPNSVLENCDRITIVEITDCPSVRICPSCHMLIEFAGDACKHMTCDGCDCDFCFVCLQIKPKTELYWPCDGAFIKCPVAPVQKMMN